MPHIEVLECKKCSGKGHDGCLDCGGTGVVRRETGWSVAEHRKPSPFKSLEDMSHHERFAYVLDLHTRELDYPKCIEVCDAILKIMDVELADIKMWRDMAVRRRR